MNMLRLFKHMFKDTLGGVPSNLEDNVEDFTLTQFKSVLPSLCVSGAGLPRAFDRIAWASAMFWPRGQSLSLFRVSALADLSMAPAARAS